MTTASVTGLEGAIPVATAVLGHQLPSVHDVVGWLSGYPAIVVLLVITVTGETVVLAAVMVATLGSWSLAEVVLWCFVGTVASDTVWFWLTGITNNRLLRERMLTRRRQRTMAWLRQRTGPRPYVALLFIKFLYGSRFLMIVYLAIRRVSLRRFVLYDGAGTVLWLAVLVPIGWLLAHGLIDAAGARRLDLVVFVVVLVLLVVRGGSAWLTSRVR